MIRKLLFTAVIVTADMLCVFAQDPHFSQFYNAQSFTNPAFIGAYEGTMRGTVNYRGQWNSVVDGNAFRTFAGSYDNRFQVSKTDHMAVGINLMNDVAGSANFNTFRAHLGGSYQKKMSGGGGRRYKRGRNDQYVNLGFQAGVGQHRFDPSLWFSNQFDATKGQIDLNAASGEPSFTRSTNTYIDINAGLLWYALMGDNKSVYAGAALLHANAPTIRFRQDKNFGEVLKWRWVMQAGAELPFSDNMSILPAVIYQRQGPSQMTVGGANIRYNSRDWREVALRMGLWTRFANRLEKGQVADALIMTAVLETEKLNFGLSYDINISKLKTASNFRGAFELSLTYIQPQERRRNSVSCPRF
jgi:type IX secretion system PorP/SprF family membrane protein